jgi:hypothetical protein
MMIDRLEADKANALRAGWMQAIEAALLIIKSKMLHLPNYANSDEDCADKVERGYGNACVNIKHSLCALTPPEGDEVAWAAKVLLARYSDSTKVSAFFGGYCPDNMGFRDVIAALKSIAGEPK